MRVGAARNFRAIQAALDKHKTAEGKKMGLTDVANSLDVSYQLVWKTAHGIDNNRRILRHFLALNVSPSDLDLPLDMLRPSAVAEALSA